MALAGFVSGISEACRVCIGTRRLGVSSNGRRSVQAEDVGAQAQMQRRRSTRARLWIEYLEAPRMEFVSFGDVEQRPGIDGPD